MAIHKHPSLHHGAHSARRAAANIQHMFHKNSGTPPPMRPGMGGGAPDPEDAAPAPGGAPSFVDQGPPAPPPPETGEG